ncbi:MAG: TIGR03663 family protein [Chloroflexi bacterium]|nr:TIGR03663 family protein [Chloroflexota bacterium]
MQVAKGVPASIGAAKGAATRLGAAKSLPARVGRSVSGIRPPRTWEGWAVLALLVLALGTRLWDLGGRALHYDEILHAWYSWLYTRDFNYVHNPLTHGPLLYHAGAATYQVIGAGEFAARLIPALFGAALVVMPWLFRKELGRYGALAVSLFLLVSPTVLYFSRFIRNDVYMAVWAVALLALALRYMERPRTWMLFAWAVIWALTFASKESAFFLVGMFGLLLAGRALPALLAWMRGQRKLSETGPAADLLIVMGTLVLPMWAPIAGLLQDVVGVILVNPDANHPLVRSGDIFRADTHTGAPVGGALYIAGFIVLALTTISVALGMVWDRRRWPLLLVTFAAVWLLLFTSLFMNPAGFFTGLWGSLGYWIAQQGVERANQPWYYYIIGLSVYEFAIAIPALVGGLYLLARRQSAFDVAIVGWTWLSFAIFSFAGERMPWLLMGIAVPCAFVAGRIAGMLIEHAATLRGGAAPARPPLSPGHSAPPVPPPQPQARGSRSERRRAARGERARRLCGVFLRLLTAPPRALGRLTVWATRTAARPFLRVSPHLAVLALGILVLAFGATVFISARASYSYAGFERPRELLVYSQTGQETPYAMECIERIAGSAGLGRNGVRILADEHDNFAWQWRWYLRDYPGIAYRSLNTSPVTEPPVEHVVMMSIWSEDANREHLADYTRLGELHTLWWFPNYAYGDITTADVLSAALSSDGWRTVLDYQLRREVGSEMQYSRGAVYVRNELVPHTLGCTSFRNVQLRDDGPAG